MRLKVLQVLTLMSIVFCATLAQAQVYTGSCYLPSVTYTASPGAVISEVSTSYSEVPDMVEGFDVSIGECVTIEFSLEVSGPVVKDLFIRAVFDENTDLVMLPQQVRLQAVPDTGSRGVYYQVQFILAVENGLGPGGHNVKIQWKGASGGKVFSRKRTLVVHHN